MSIYTVVEMDLTACNVEHFKKLFNCLIVRSDDSDTGSSDVEDYFFCLKFSTLYFVLINLIFYFVLINLVLIKQ